MPCPPNPNDAYFPPPQPMVANVARILRPPLGQMCICQDYKEKYTRAFRLAHTHQLRRFCICPFLQPLEHGRQGYGRKACVSSAKIQLEAYLVIYESDSATTSIDNAFKLSALSALTAAVIVFLDLIGEGRHASQRNGYDEALINRTITALRGCAEGKPG